MKFLHKTKFKRIISGILVAAMFISILPFQSGIEVYAEDDPYIELTNTLTAQDTFAWTEYDHKEYTDRYLGYMPSHIIYDGDNIQMVGYGVKPYKDFLFVESENTINEHTDLKQTFTFDIQRDSTSWHSMECGGFLFNSSISDGILNGYGALITNGAFKIIHLKNINVDSLHEGSPSSLINSSNTLKSVSFPNSTAVHNMKIEVYNNTVSVWDGDSMIIDNYTLSSNDYGYGYGPITSYASHSCSQKSYFTFANIVMQQVVIHYTPKKPVELAYTVNENSSITLTWTQPEGKADVAGYNIYCDNELIGTSYDTTYTDETAASLGNFTYYVSAFDTENYTSENSDTVTVDNLSPTAPDLMIDSAGKNSISLIWECSDNVGVESYDIYRNDEFVTSVTTNSYTDAMLEEGTSYTYYIVAYDASGNKSDNSNTITVNTQIDETSPVAPSDKVIPEIVSIYPENGGILKNNQCIGILAKDNYKLDNLTVECRPENGNWYTVFREENINIYGKAIQFELDTSTFATGIYEIRTFAEDVAGNRSEYVTNSYTFKACEISVPVLSVEAGNLESSLSWEMENDIDVSYYEIYRSSQDSFEYIHKTTEKEYVDTDLDAQKYTYYVVAVDKYENKKTSEYVDVIPLNVDHKEPIAYAGADIVAFENENVSFDGTTSTDNVGVAAYRWDFGDGTSSDTGATVHSYDEAGTYDTLLTVYDEAGNKGTSTKRITILDSDNLSAELTVTTSSNEPISGVMVYYELTDDSKSTIYTNKYGKASINSAEGIVTVYLYKKGFAPVKKDIEINKNQLKHSVQLEKKDLIIGEVKVEELDLQQMIAHNIDITAPENQAVFKVSVQVAYAEDTNGKSEVNVLINTKGDIIPGTIEVKLDDIEYSHDTTSGTVTIKRKKKSSSSSSESTATIKPIIGSEDKIAGIAVLKISHDVTWLKECFDVELSVTNCSGEEFPINGANASLILPDGLTLAKMEKLQSMAIDWDNISGGEIKTASWTVMGSKEGEYSVSAEFSGTLMPFESKVLTSFKSPDKIKIYGGSALEYYQLSRVYTDDGMKINTYFTVTNVSDKSIYNVSANLGDIKELNDVKEMKLVYPDGTVIYVKRDSGTTPKPEFLAALHKSGDYGYLELKPKECVIGTYSVSISEEAMQAAAQAVNNLDITLDESGKILNSIGKIDTKYYDNSVRAIAVDLASRTNNNLLSLPNSFKPTALTVALDISTGKIYIGFSGKEGNPTRSSVESEFVSDRINKVCTDNNCTAEVGLTPRPRNMRNCGEYNAINNALNDGVNYSNLYIYTVYINNGDYLRACDNCRALYAGYVNIIGDDSGMLNTDLERDR